MVALFFERVKNIMGKYLYLSLIIFLIGCDKNPDKVVLDSFENIHASSVYYVVQNEEAKIIENNSDTSFVELCYEIRKNLGTVFISECSVVKLKLVNKEWVITQTLQKDEKGTCWIKKLATPQSQERLDSLIRIERCLETGPSRYR